MYVLKLASVYSFDQDEYDYDTTIECVDFYVDSGTLYYIMGSSDYYASCNIATSRMLVRYIEDI